MLISETTQSVVCHGFEIISIFTLAWRIWLLSFDSCATLLLVTDLNNDSHCRDFPFVFFLSPFTSALPELAPLITTFPLSFFLPVA